MNKNNYYLIYISFYIFYGWFIYLGGWGALSPSLSPLHLNFIVVLLQMVNTKTISRIARIAERGERNHDKHYVSQHANLDLSVLRTWTHSSVVVASKIQPRKFSSIVPQMHCSISTDTSQLVFLVKSKILDFFSLIQVSNKA